MAAVEGRIVCSATVTPPRMTTIRKSSSMYDFAFSRPLPNESLSVRTTSVEIFESMLSSWGGPEVT